MVIYSLLKFYYFSSYSKASPSLEVHSILLESLDIFAGFELISYLQSSILVRVPFVANFGVGLTELPANTWILLSLILSLLGMFEEIGVEVANILIESF